MKILNTTGLIMFIRQVCQMDSGWKMIGCYSEEGAEPQMIEMGKKEHTIKMSDVRTREPKPTVQKCSLRTSSTPSRVDT